MALTVARNLTRMNAGLRAGWDMRFGRRMYQPVSSQIVWYSEFQALILAAASRGMSAGSHQKCLLRVSGDSFADTLEHLPMGRALRQTLQPGATETADSRRRA